MTWLSLRSGMASIGVVSSAQYPHAPTSKKKPTTRKRLRSDVSMSQLITCSDTPSPTGIRTPARRVPVMRTDYGLGGEGSRSGRKLDDTEDAARAGLRRRGHRRTDEQKHWFALGDGDHRGAGATWRFTHAGHRGATSKGHGDRTGNEPDHGDSDHEPGSAQ